MNVNDFLLEICYNIVGDSMKVKCRYCDSFISDTCERCPNCGAVNEELKRVGDGVPTTISELKKWYVDHNLPDEVVTRFFIGKDYKEARAFGIYYDESKDLYIVYKNKDNGERKIRYEGKDEKYAVNELYMKLKEEILNQKSLNRNHFKNSNNFSIFDNKFSNNDSEPFCTSCYNGRFYFAPTQQCLTNCSNLYESNDTRNECVNCKNEGKFKLIDQNECIEEKDSCSIFLDKDGQKICLENNLFKPFLKKDNNIILEPYNAVNSNYKLLFPYNLEDNKAKPLTLKELRQFSKTYEYLQNNKKDLLNRSKIDSKVWWKYPYPKNLAIMESPKLIIPVLSINPRCIYDEDGLYITGGGGGPFYGLRPLNENISIFYLMGILNSKLFQFVIFNVSTAMRGGYYRYSKQYIENMNIPIISDENKDIYQNIIFNVKKCIEYNKKIAKSNVPKEIRILNMELDDLKYKINQLVYELYELTEEEIEIVENSLNN